MESTLKPIYVLLFTLVYLQMESTVSDIKKKGHRKNGSFLYQFLAAI